jgi:dephospho-CoA kinase
MKIIGLTGGIASGKNFVAEIFAQNGAAVFDADFEVHQLFASDKLVIERIKKNFPESFIEGKIERKILGKIVFGDAEKLAILEKILHPKVREKYQEFLVNAQKSKKKIVVLNIPLLLEKQGYSCDKIVALLAPKSVRKRRFLARCRKNNPKIFAAEKKNFEEKFLQICANQITDLERKSKADFVINSNKSKLEIEAQIKNYSQILKKN